MENKTPKRGEVWHKVTALLLLPSYLIPQYQACQQLLQDVDINLFCTLKGALPCKEHFKGNSHFSCLKKVADGIKLTNINVLHSCLIGWSLLSGDGLSERVQVGDHLASQIVNDKASWSISQGFQGVALHL